MRSEKLFPTNQKFGQVVLRLPIHTAKERLVVGWEMQLPGARQRQLTLSELITPSVESELAEIAATVSVALPYIKRLVLIKSQLLDLSILRSWYPIG